MDSSRFRLALTAALALAIVSPASRVQAQQATEPIHQLDGGAALVASLRF